MTRWRLIGLAVAVVLAVVGWIVVDVSTRSPAAIATEAADYVPSCDGKLMSPGDQCVTSDGPAAKTYDELKAEVTVDSLRSQYANRRVAGLILIAVGGLLAASVIARTALVARARRRRSATPA
jgi:hypothetical protein